MMMSTGYFYFQATHHGNRRNRRNRCSFVIGSRDPLAINAVAFAHPGVSPHSFHSSPKMASKKTGVTPICYFACYVTSLSYLFIVTCYFLVCLTAFVT